jgi:hypothetical protein
MYLPFKIGPIGFPETSVTTNQGYVTEEQMSHLQSGGSFKSLNPVVAKVFMKQFRIMSLYFVQNFSG